MPKHELTDDGCKVTLDDGVKIEFFTLKPGTFWAISVEDALENSEALLQFQEGASYEYKITEGYEIKGSPRTFRQSKISSWTGNFTPGNQVGSLTISYGHVGIPETIGDLTVEIRSVKTNYRTDYRVMLGEITDYCTELIMQAGSEVHQMFRLDPSTKAATLYQKFSFVRSLIDNPEILNAIHRITTSPVTKWKEEFEHKDISRLKRLSGKQIRALATVASGHSTRILSSVKRETVDCAENRFIKFALRSFADACLRVAVHLPGNSREKREAERIENLLSAFLTGSFFSSIDNISSIPFNSQVLQKKAGYREIFKAWLMLDVAGRLSWEGGEDVYKAGKRDVATLYEYWLFFKLLQAIVEVFRLQSPDINKLIEQTEDGLGLKLKQGNHLVIAGVANLPTRKLNVEFNYNKTFTRPKKYPEGGSWSVNLRPDYTLTIWPVGFSKSDAERNELITHIHFDSKYRLDQSPIANLGELGFDKKNDDLGSYKIEDLQKMHTYRDAIRRTAGAYVLYPGSHSENLSGFHEILPGLGAFAIAPSNAETGVSELKSFLTEVADLLINRSSHREIISYRTYETYKEVKPAPLKFMLPELQNFARVRPPSETMVLVGYYKSSEHLDWILNTGQYNTRLNTENVALDLIPALTGARYLLLYNDDEMVTNKLLQIVSAGPRVISKAELQTRQYPTVPSREYYLLFDVSEVADPELKNHLWDVSKLLTAENVRGLPFIVSLEAAVRCIER